MLTIAVGPSAAPSWRVVNLAIASVQRAVLVAAADRTLGNFRPTAGAPVRPREMSRAASRPPP